jgi:hypothetical protein
MVDRLKPGRDGLNYIERTVLAIITARAERGKPAPSQTALLNEFSDRGVYLAPNKIAAAKGRLAQLGLIEVENKPGAHIHRQRILVVATGHWTGWTDNQDFHHTARSVERACIVPRCGKLFRSSGPGNRMCPKCRTSVEASPMDFSYQSSAYRVEQR